MSDFVKVFETTGAVSISVDNEYVSIRQDSVHGDDEGQVSIPRPLFKEVLATIFHSLETFELQEIAELAEDVNKAKGA